MIRQKLKRGALVVSCFLFSIFATGTQGDPSELCQPRSFNATYNITDSNECDKYYECSEGNTTTKFCERGLRFSKQLERCEEAKKVNCTGRDFNPRSDLIDPKDCNITHSLFMCQYGKECISTSQVCDGFFDCLDASDEFSHCNSSCDASTCAHKCIPNPDPNSQGTCVCNEGYAISPTNKSACVDIDECELFGKCSQFCTNTVGSFQCSCMSGFKRDENNATACTVIEPSWNLLYATRSDIRLTVNNNGKEMSFKVTHNEGRPVGVTYDARNNVTYWTDVTTSSEAIYRGTLDGNKIEVVADSGLLLPEGIAFDWITGNIYFVDSNLSQVAVCRNDTISNFCSVLVQELIDKPRDIALHPNKGIMFWTDWGSAPAIMRAGMDGSTPLAIVSNDLKWPNGITVDQGNSRVYWVDAGLDSLETALLDGSDRHVVFRTRNMHPFGIDILGDRIFWSDWSSQEIKSAYKFTGRNSTVHILDTHTLINGLALFHQVNQPISRSNPCANAGCSHICTLSPTSFRCFCPTGMVLRETDGKTCEEPSGVPKLLVAFKNTIKTMRFNSIGKDVFTSIHLPQIKSITAVVYNPINHTVILSDSASKKIYEYDINKDRLDVLIDQHLDNVKGMEIDIVGENLYWIDAGRQTLEVMSFRTRARVKLMNTGENPSDIVLVPDERSLFMARIGRRGGKIYKMFMNGYSNSVLQRVGNKEPVALTYDKDAGLILWADKVSRSIESLSTDGQGALITRQPSPPYDVVKHKNKIFWTDMFTQELKSIALGSQQYVSTIRLGSFENNSSSPNNSISFLGKLAVINRDLSDLEDLRSKHECSVKSSKNKGCSHLCLLSGNGFSGFCLCPEGLTLDHDGLTCVKPSVCGTDQFTCSDGFCINREYICDGVPDCSHHDDEVNCNQTSCQADTFKCESNGVCIPVHWVCDGESDCAEGEDEKTCTYVPCNEDFDFRCNSTGRCIPKSWRCDFASDCPGDDSDERGCNFTCPEGFYECPSQKCIIADWICDGEKDCEDGSDEATNCAVKSCSEEQFACHSGKCLDKSQKCDGIIHCANSEDELNCEPKHEVKMSNMTTTAISDDDDDEGGSSGKTVAIVFGVIVIIVLVAIIIALVLHKNNLQPKVLVRPYVQQWNKYINEPARRMFRDGRGQQKLDCEGNVYDEVYAGGSVTYCNNALYEEVDGGVTEFEAHSSLDKRSQRDAAARSFADSGILGSERESLYEEAEDCGSHYVSYNQKDKLLIN